jgi:hypothetical protein
MSKSKSNGKCVYCQKLCSKGTITRHLETHLLKEEELPKIEIGIAVHLAVTNGDFFLHLLVPENASLKTIDTFLRKIWLECCGHLSEFTTADSNEVAMTIKVRTIFQQTYKLKYEYDFGSTTQLDIELKGVYSIPLKRIVLLSRNEPLPIM